MAPTMGKEEEIELQAKTDIVSVSFKTLFRYATTGDILLMIAGILSAIIAGATFPLTTVVFGMNYTAKK